MLVGAFCLHQQQLNYLQKKERKKQTWWVEVKQYKKKKRKRKKKANKKEWKAIFEKYNEQYCVCMGKKTKVVGGQQVFHFTCIIIN